MLGKESGSEGKALTRTGVKAKIIIVLQTLVIMFLGYWMFEEYENNVYFNTYVNGIVQANMLMLAGGLVGLPALTILVLVMKRSRRGSSHIKLGDVDENVGGPTGSFGAVQPGGSQGPSSLAAELSSRFLGQITASDSASPPAATGHIVTRGGMPILQKPDQAEAPTPKPAASAGGLPLLQKVDEPLQNFEAPQLTSGPPRRDSGYAPPNFQRPPDNPGVRRPPISAPTVRPPTVVTGIMGSSPRPYSPPPPQPQPSNRQAQPGPRYDNNWQAGARPPAPLGVPPRPSQFAPSPPRPLPPGAGGSGPTPPPLGRIGPARSAADKTPGAESSPVLNRVEPVQGAPPPSWPRSVSSTDRSAGSSSGAEDSAASGGSFSNVPGGGKTPVKRDDKQQSSQENSGS